MWTVISDVQPACRAAPRHTSRLVVRGGYVTLPRPFVKARLLGQDPAAVKEELTSIKT